MPIFKKLSTIFIILIFASFKAYAESKTSDIQNNFTTHTKNILQGNIELNAKSHKMWWDLVNEMTSDNPDQFIEHLRSTYNNYGKEFMAETWKCAELSRVAGKPVRSERLDSLEHSIIEENAYKAGIVKWSEEYYDLFKDENKPQSIKNAQLIIEAAAVGGTIENMTGIIEVNEETINLVLNNLNLYEQTLNSLLDKSYFK